MKKMVILSFILPMFVLSYSAYAFHGHHGSMQWWKNTDVLSKLQLTNDQINSLNSIYKSNRGQISNLYSQLKGDRSALGQAISTNGDIQVAANKIVQDETTLINTRMTMFVQLINQLNPQQKQELEQIFQSHHKTFVSPTPAP